MSRKGPRRRSERLARPSSFPWQRFPEDPVPGVRYRAERWQLYLGSQDPENLHTFTVEYEPAREAP